LKHREKEYAMLTINADLLKTVQNVRNNAVLLENIKKNSTAIKATLGNFKIEVEIAGIKVGASAIRFEFKLLNSVSLNKIKKLGDDIALAIGEKNIRILAPVPGKTVIGVEYENPNREIISIKEIITGENFNNTEKHLPVCLGKTITGEEVVEDITEFPHVLIAGTTGSGKSICINSIIVSLLAKFGEEEVKFVMVDPKMVELTKYNGIKQLLYPVATSIEDSLAVLGSVEGIMLARYKDFQKVGANDIISYNKIAETKLPYIVVVVDEFADLMLQAKKETEVIISRIVAMSRAVGIHTVLATQRPSVDVITGVIKANFPTRIALKVATGIDSRTILGVEGAEKLLGKGDMLISATKASEIKRVQGVLVTDEEIKGVVSYFIGKNGRGTQTIPAVTSKKNSGEKSIVLKKGDVVIKERTLWHKAETKEVLWTVKATNFVPDKYYDYEELDSLTKENITYTIKN
jgi:DNA segregation ATPase FtsK/SpoIIIE, S-DNA-T family